MGACSPQNPGLSVMDTNEEKVFGSFRPSNKGMRELVEDPKNGRAKHLDSGETVNSVNEAMGASIYEEVCFITKQNGSEIHLS